MMDATKSIQALNNLFDESSMLKGAAAGHPFYGNQYTSESAGEASESAMDASLSAKIADRDGDVKRSKAAHRAAADAHDNAAKQFEALSTSGSIKDRKFNAREASAHKGMAATHKAKAG